MKKFCVLNFLTYYVGKLYAYLAKKRKAVWTAEMKKVEAKIERDAFYKKWLEKNEC